MLKIETDLSSLFKKGHVSELILAILFIIYLIMGSKTPEPIANIIDSLGGKIVIFIVVIYMFMNSNPVLAVLALFVAFDFSTLNYLELINFGFIFLRNLIHLLFL